MFSFVFSLPDSSDIFPSPSPSSLFPHLLFLALLFQAGAVSLPHHVIPPPPPVVAAAPLTLLSAPGAAPTLSCVVLDHARAALFSFPPPSFFLVPPSVSSSSLLPPSFVLRAPPGVFLFSLAPPLPLLNAPETRHPLNRPDVVLPKVPSEVLPRPRPGLDAVRVLFYAVPGLSRVSLSFRAPRSLPLKKYACNPEVFLIV